MDNSLGDISFKQINAPQSRIRCYCVSDIHAESNQNRRWVHEKCHPHPEDNDCFTVFMLPGDVATDIDCLESIFREMVSRFHAVCYVPGNHEAWVKKKSNFKLGSLDKLKSILDCAKKCGVYVGPLRIQGLGCSLFLCPLYSWYHSGFDTEPEIADTDYKRVEEAVPFEKKWSDFAFCRWPESIVSHEEFTSLTSNHVGLAKLFAKFNDPFLSPQAPSMTPMQVLRKSGISLLESIFRTFSSDNMVKSDTPSPGPPRKRTTSTVNMYAGAETEAHGDVDSVSNADISSSTLLSADQLAGAPQSPSAEIVRKMSSANLSGVTAPFTNRSSRSSSTKTVAEAPLTPPSQQVPRSSCPFIQEGDTVISFSHFLPRKECCPEKRFLIEPLLPRVVGSEFLEAQVRQLRPHLHMFGHTHIPIDVDVEGITYIQWPLGYFKEATIQCSPIFANGPMLISDTALGIGAAGIVPAAQRPSRQTYWSVYYDKHTRDPTDPILSWWLRKKVDTYVAVMEGRPPPPDSAYGPSAFEDAMGGGEHIGGQSELLDHLPTESPSLSPAPSNEKI